MRKSRAGRPKLGYKQKKTKVVSFRLSDDAIIKLDKLCRAAKKLTNKKVSRSTMIELLLLYTDIDIAANLDKYRKLLDDERSYNKDESI